MRSIRLVCRVGLLVALCSALPVSAWAQAPAPTPTPATTVAPPPAQAAPVPAPEVAPAPPPEPAAAPPIAVPIATALPDALPAADVARLDGVLEKLADHTAISAGDIFYGLLLSGVNLFAGIYVGVDGAEMGIGEGRAAVSAALIGFGAIGLANTIHGIGRETTDELRLTRFRAARASGSLDRIALARFEGELQAEVDVARYQRIVGGVQFIGMAVGGAGVIAIAAGVDDLSDDGRMVAGIVGGTYLVLGTWQAIALLAGESFYERIQRDYQQSRMAAPATQVSVTPAVGPNAFGVNVSATF